MKGKSFLIIIAYFTMLSLNAQDKNYEEWYLRTNDNQRIFVKELGTGRDTIIVIHGGFGANHDYMTDIVKGLENTFHFVFYDQRGSLLSEVPDTLITFGKNLDDLLTLINSLKINGHIHTFYIDGKYNDFTNNWRGEVIASKEYGYSTITLDTPYDTIHTEGCYSSDTLWLVPNSPIGIYKLQNSGVTSTLTLTYIKNDSSDAIQYKVMNDTTDGTKIDFAMQTSRANIVSAGGPTNRILEYHGATPKVGQLYNNACYAVFRKMWYDNAKSGKCYAIIPDSPHYD